MASITTTIFWYGRLKSPRKLIAGGSGIFDIDSKRLFNSTMSTGCFPQYIWPFAFIDITWNSISGLAFEGFSSCFGRLMVIVFYNIGVLIINIISNENAKSMSGVTLSSVIAAKPLLALNFILVEISQRCRSVFVIVF